MHRRDFLAATAGIGAALGSDWARPARQGRGGPRLSHEDPQGADQTQPGEDEWKKLKEAGFEGVEAVW